MVSNKDFHEVLWSSWLSMAAVVPSLAVPWQPGWGLQQSQQGSHPRQPQGQVAVSLSCLPTELPLVSLTPQAPFGAEG